MNKTKRYEQIIENQFNARLRKLTGLKGKLATVEICNHKYVERTTAPLGVACIYCGHFVGAWE